MTLPGGSANYSYDVTVKNGTTVLPAKEYVLTKPDFTVSTNNAVGDHTVTVADAISIAAETRAYPFSTGTSAVPSTL